MLMAPATHGLLSVISVAPVFTVAPFITGNTAGPGVAQTSDTLTVNYTITGQPAPAVTYSWYATSRPTDTLLSTAVTIVGLLGPWAGSYVYCSVIATNSTGVATLATAQVFVSGGG